MNIFITLDYELFLGIPVGSLENCIIKPMMSIDSVLDETNSKLTVFVDGAYLVRLEQLCQNYPQLKSDFDLVKDNIKTLNEKGHSIQYHFHPQWLYSSYTEGIWQIDNKHYSLSDLSEQIRKSSFKHGIEIIESITGNKIFAFRAGGYSLGSYDIYESLFSTNGITIDSSVRSGTYSHGCFQRYDYRKTPKKSMYKFKYDICHEEKDGFIELPISMSKAESSINYLLRKRNLAKQYNPNIVYGDGKSVDTLLNRQQRINQLAHKLFGKMLTPASIDGITSLDLCRIYKWHKNNNQENFVIIGHPKLATDASIRVLKLFINMALANGDKFCVIDDLYKK